MPLFCKHHSAVSCAGGALLVSFIVSLLRRTLSFIVFACVVDCVPCAFDVFDRSLM